VLVLALLGGDFLALVLVLRRKKLMTVSRGNTDLTPNPAHWGDCLAGRWRVGERRGGWRRGSRIGLLGRGGVGGGGGVLRGGTRGDSLFGRSGLLGSGVSGLEGEKGGRTCS
jgi:hypothetical protein